MEVPLFLAADYANKGEDQKINVLGVFNVINVKQFPARHRTLYLVIRIVAELGEFDFPHNMQVIFNDEDGNELGAQQGKITLTKPPSGMRSYADLIIEVQDLRLEKPGRHEFRLLINRDLKAILPLDVVHIRE